ncbi:MAG: FAD-dependent oxidoreductase [Spirochaetia bacterium]|nr:FAD-dependent oxidoreductase [Spirochaetia bacterium]
MKNAYQSIFETFFDAAIFGVGYAGFAAARALSGKGKRVLLVDRQGAALWEGGWSFFTDAGVENDSLWREWSAELEKRGILRNGEIDGACAEVAASEYLNNGKISTLYFAAPLWVERDEKNLMQSVVVGTKSGLRRIRAAQFIDATEDAELARLLDPKAVPLAPVKKEIRLHFQQSSWENNSRIHLESNVPETELSFEPAHWENERRLRISIPGTKSGVFSSWTPALQTLRREKKVDMENAILTHGSLRPYPIYETASPKSLDLLPANLALAVPGLSGRAIKNLSGRFMLGVAAAYSLEAKPFAQKNDGRDAFDVPVFPEKKSEIAVAGTGTGGLLAGVAAGKCGAEVAALELLPYAGGIGAGGGIHWYYFGVSGGLQEELDERTRTLMPLFGKKNQVMGFHPDAKKTAAEAMLREAGVNFLPGSIVVSVEESVGRVERALVSTPEGPFWLSAKAWIDATGDGDLAAGAGAAFHFGRQGDGLLHHFSQSSGAAREQNGNLRMDVVNYDAGFVDPTDPEDLTRARLLGISQYSQAVYKAAARPTYIAPALGLRQSRHIVCDTMLSLDDLIVNRQFPDAVGMTGCHYDNHAADYELESDESLFWVWGCRNWRKRTGSDIPYRMLLPKGIENVWVACRAFGVTEEAHHSMRMQRDIQRVGEVAGYAAALSLKANGRSREVVYADLKNLLLKTGALKPRNEDSREDFGPFQELSFFNSTAGNISLSQTEIRLKELEDSSDSTCLWHLYKSREASETGVLKKLHSSNPRTSWRAALVAAMWGRPEAEPRLLQAIRSRESGFEESDEKDRPEQNNRVAPNWITAAALLRRCGTRACLPELKALAASKDALFNIRTAISLTLERLAERLKSDAGCRTLVEEILEILFQGEATCIPDLPGRNILFNKSSLKKDEASARPPAQDDLSWQLPFTATKALVAWGMPDPFRYAIPFKNDPRAYVRRAFTTLPIPPSTKAGKLPALSSI